MLGKQALKALVDADCDESIILQNLYLFCGGNPETTKAVRKELKFDDRSETMLEIACLLRKTSSKIPIAEELLADLDVTTHNVTPEGAALDQYAALLEWAAKQYHKLGNGKISGRDQHLVFLFRYIQRVTVQEHYREIADLVNATRDFYYPGTAEDETYESIRKRISRHSRHQDCHDVEIEATLETTKLRQPDGRTEP
jgi:hypothetical protein